MKSYFKGGTIVQSLTSCNKYEAIRELIYKAPIFSKVKDKKKLERDVILREKSMSTGLGRGVALAHGTTSAVKNIVIVLGISKKGINFDSIDKVPVHLLFMITNPPNKQVDYLIALSTVARLLRDDAFRESLNDSVPSEVIETKICDAFNSCLKKYNKVAV